MKNKNKIMCRMFIAWVVFQIRNALLFDTRRAPHTTSKKSTLRRHAPRPENTATKVEHGREEGIAMTRIQSEIVVRPP